MNAREKGIAAIILSVGSILLVFITWQIAQVAGEPLPPTASLEQALTELASRAQPTPVLAVVSTLDAPTSSASAAVPKLLVLSPTITDTPVLALGRATLTPTPAPTEVSIYVVESGDTLYVLAFRFGLTVDELKVANGLDDNTIYTGQKLIIPVPGLNLPTRAPKPSAVPGATRVSTQPAAAGGNFGALPIPGPSPTWSVQAIPTRLPATGPTKLGIHVTLNSGGVLDYVAAVHPPVMKGVDDIGYLKDVKAISPNTITLGRYVVLQENIGQGDPAQRALDFVNEYLPKYQAAPWVDYWEGWNEVTYPNYEWYAIFEATRACEMQKHGLKAAIGGFSTGTPEPWQFEAFIPAIEAGIRCGAILTTHEYGAPTLYLWWSQGMPESLGHPAVPAYPDRGPLLGRYRYLYYNMLLPRGLNIPLVISETGIDGGAGAGQRPGYSNAQGWLGFNDYWGKELGVTDPVQFYVDQLAWYDSMLRQDSFVIGATIFNIGASSSWASFDVSPILPKLTEYAQALK